MEAHLSGAARGRQNQDGVVGIAVVALTSSASLRPCVGAGVSTSWEGLKEMVMTRSAGGRSPTERLVSPPSPTRLTRRFGGSQRQGVAKRGSSRRRVAGYHPPRVCREVWSATSSPRRRSPPHADLGARRFSAAPGDVGRQ